jgi:hypothetical protein
MARACLRSYAGANSSALADGSEWRVSSTRPRSVVASLRNGQALAGPPQPDSQPDGIARLTSEHTHRPTYREGVGIASGSSSVDRSSSSSSFAVQSIGRVCGRRCLGFAG